MSNAPVRPVSMGPRQTTLTRRADGALLMRSPVPLEPYPRSLTDRFAHWAAVAPDRLWIAQRDPSGHWR